MEKAANRQRHGKFHRLHNAFSDFKNNGIYYTFVLAILVTNIILFCYGVMYQVNSPTLGISNYLLPAGRGFGVTLEFNCALILIPMCHGWMTFLRRWSFFSLIVPFNYLHLLHIFFSRLILLGIIVHGGLQFTHFISASFLEPVDSVWGTKFNGGINLFVTGVVLTIVFFVILFFTIKKIRIKLPYESFFYSHHLFIVFYAILLIHGQRGGKLEFWKWFLLPGFLYVTDRIYRLFLQNCWNRHCKAISIQYFDSSKVTKLEIPKLFDYEPGQYAELRIPYLSSYQVHPFTIASSPADDTMIFYIKSYGKWTTKLADYAQSEGNAEDLTVFISGPYGAPAQFSFHFDHLLFIGAGIGATPFVSAMRHATHLCDNLDVIEHESENHDISLQWAKNHMQTIDWIEEFDDIHTIAHSESTESIATIYSESILDNNQKISTRIHRLASKLFRISTSILSYIIQLWVVLLCILIEAINKIFFDGLLDGLTYTTLIILGLLLFFLLFELFLEIVIHGFLHYFKNFRRFLSLLDVPILFVLVSLCFISEILKDQKSIVFEIVMFVCLGVLFIYLFIRLTLRVGSKNVLQLPHGKKVACVRSVDFVWVNSTNNDMEWMLDDLKHLDDHHKSCRSNCAQGLTFHHQLYITREEPSMKSSFKNIEFLSGRPNWHNIFEGTKDRVLSHAMQQGNSIGVFFCGPPSLGEIIRKECIIQTILSKKYKTPLYFIYHQEIF